jgi:hypothetical protein
MGDGVNIAARLQSIATPGGICISDDTYRQEDSCDPRRMSVRQQCQRLRRLQNFLDSAAGSQAGNETTGNPSGARRRLAPVVARRRLAG